jgi:hypothetical protein
VTGRETSDEHDPRAKDETMTQYVTPDEAAVIAKAVQLGTDFVGIHIITPNGEWDAQACGRCGRLICHPDCSRWRETLTPHD